jgi:hypothetical protein
MAIAINELLTIMNDGKLLDGCSETREAVTRLYIVFRESQRFPRPISSKKIGFLLPIDAKTVWIHRKHFQWHELAKVENGRPPIPSDEQLDQVVHFGTEQFCAVQPVDGPGCSASNLCWSTDGNPEGNN